MKSTSAAIILAVIVYWHVGAQDISELLNAESPLCQTPSEDDLNEQLNVFNKIEDVNDITKINFHGIDWADLLYPAPAAIGVLGSLLSITQKYNPALSEFPFLYVKYPNSLGTSLTEIVRKMHWVFVRSHQDVEQMRHDTTLVPEFFRNIIRIANGEIEDYDMSMIKSVASAYIDPIDGIKNVLLEVEELQLACIQQRKMNTNDSSKVQSLSKTIEQLGALRVYGRELSHFIKTIFEVVVKRWQNALLNFIDSAMEPEMLGLFPGSNVTTDIVYSLMVNHRVQRIAETYTNYSSTHLLPALKDTQLLMNMFVQSATFEITLRELQTKIRRAEEKVLKVISKESDLFKEYSSIMYQKMEAQLRDICRNTTASEGDA